MAQVDEKTTFDIEQSLFEEVQLELLCGTKREDCAVKFTATSLKINGKNAIPYSSIIDVESEAHTQCGGDKEIKSPYLIKKQGTCATLYSLVAYRDKGIIRTGLFIALKRTTYDSFVINLFLRRHNPAIN